MERKNPNNLRFFLQIINKWRLIKSITSISGRMRFTGIFNDTRSVVTHICKAFICKCDRLSRSNKLSQFADFSLVLKL